MRSMATIDDVNALFEDAALASAKPWPSDPPRPSKP